MKPCLRRPRLCRCLLLLGTALALSFATPASAQVVRRGPPWGPQKGDGELTLSGGGASDNEFTTGNGSVNLSLGTFLDNNWELSLRQSLSFDNDAESFDVRGATRVGLDYHLNFQKFRPFVGITLGGGYGDDIAAFFLAGGEVGLKYYLQRKTFVFALVDYSWAFDNWEQITSNIDTGALGYSIGIGLHF